MRRAWVIAIILIILTLPSCTVKEWQQIACDNPEGVKERMLCLWLSMDASSEPDDGGGSVSKPKSECSKDADCKSACDKGLNIMDGKCKDGKCLLEYAYSCTETNGVDSKCMMEGGKPKCTTPPDQCSSDAQCPSKCDGKNVVDGKCAGGRCAYAFAYSCEENGIDSKCVTANGKATCTQPENQCAFDDDCSDACRDDDVMEGYCEKGRCALLFVESCDTKQDCTVRDGRAFCG